ncbi:hypothetical protein [Pseudogemmobacter bohemicus]|nr:hypothetical protein [Pseudogemmobacter bohemicus]
MVVIIGITAYVAFVKDQAEQAMLAAGGCTKVMDLDALWLHRQGV